LKENNTTLAKFVFETREKLGYTKRRLAERAHLELSQIESIEEGQELFLSSTVRQKLAKALKTENRKIKALEKEVMLDENLPLADYIEEVKLRILNGIMTGNICPKCKSELKCRAEIMYDLEDNEVKHPKAICSKCPFQIR
jgi:transcriptional regulator with XRE-family HTH domain